MNLELYSILLLPLFASAVVALFFRTSGRVGSIFSAGASAVALALLLKFVLSDSFGIYKDSLILYSLGGFSLNMGILFDSLTANMLFVVCFVGFLIIVYSAGYMKGDEGVGRFFAGISFFMFSMTGIVMSSNLFMMFVFWELVGFSSYALIAHYASTEAARSASKKAFIVNRVGDFGFLLGIVWCQAKFGTTDFSVLAEIFKASPGDAVTGMGLLVMCGFLGKSAQLPLHVWLPDAMAGPTPVSALIHAATMVAAGIYMMVRLSVVGFLTPEVLDTVLILSALMAFLGGVWALAQSDIKKILAYSTLAHLGLMGVGIGAGSELAMFHLTTHAFFKATLFLVAGAVIIACHHEQDIFKMGGLAKKMPVTFVVSAVAVCAIMAIPFFSGYYSKEAVLAAVFAKASDGVLVHSAAFWITLFAAFLTPIYTLRFFLLVFFGAPRSESASKAREVSFLMTVPMAILAVYSLCAGWSYVYDFQWMNGKFNFLIPTAASEFVGKGIASRHAEAFLNSGLETFEIVAVAMTFAAVVVAILLYRSGKDRIKESLPLAYGEIARCGRFDEIYNYYVAKVQQRFADLLATFVDLFLIEILSVRGIGAFCAVLGCGVKKLHSSRCGAQVAWLGAGLAFVFFLVFAA